MPPLGTSPLTEAALVSYDQIPLSNFVGWSMESSLNDGRRSRVREALHIVIFIPFPPSRHSAFRGFVRSTSMHTLANLPREMFNVVSSTFSIFSMQLSARSSHFIVYYSRVTLGIEHTLTGGWSEHSPPWNSVSTIGHECNDLHPSKDSLATCYNKNFMMKKSLFKSIKEIICWGLHIKWILFNSYW